MVYLIGTDEAGYGPNLGPLLVASSVWKISENPAEYDLYQILEGLVTDQVSAEKDHNKLVITDSKKLYQSRQSLNRLERTLFPLFACLGIQAKTWRDMWHGLCPSSQISLDHLPWYRDFDIPLPQDFSRSEILPWKERFLQTSETAGVQLLKLRARAVFPFEFNTQVEALGSKSSLLSEVTLSLVKELLDSLGAHNIFISCDKHGARNRYGAILQQKFPDNLIEVVRESRTVSTYCWGPSSRRIKIQFKAKGESFLPTALASMVAKYLRELAMLAFNKFWCGHNPEIRPTAGYPLDAKRFRAEIETTRQRLEIQPQKLWRNR